MHMAEHNCQKLNKTAANQRKVRKQTVLVVAFNKASIEYFTRFKSFYLNSILYKIQILRIIDLDECRLIRCIAMFILNFFNPYIPLIVSCMVHVF